MDSSNNEISTKTIEQRLAALSPEHRVLLQKIQAKKAGDTTSENIRQNARPGKYYRLSPAQRRLWILDKMEQSGDVYNVPSLYFLHGPLDTAVLSSAIDMLVDRHWILQTRFVVVDGEPMQYIDKDIPVSLEVHSLEQAFSTSQSRTNVTQPELITRTLESFDLKSGPLIRIHLYKLDTQTHALMFVMHHIISDGWSMRVLMRELGQIYQSKLMPTPQNLEALPIQFADYAEWFCNQIAGNKFDEGIAYWTNQLKNAPPLELPTQRLRSREQRFAAGTFAFDFSAGLTDDMKQVAAREQITPFTFLLAVLYVLLFRYSSQKDISVGTNVAGRVHRQTAKLIGFFINTIVLRADLSGDPRFLTFLHHVRETAMTGFKHQDVPFERIVEAVQPERVINRNPLYQVVISQHMPEENFSFAGIEVERPPRQRLASQVDLEIYLGDTDTGITGEIIYSTALFDAAFIERLAANYVALLSEIVADPDQHLSTYAGISDEEREKVLALSYGKEADYSSLGCVHQEFERQVLATPEATAIVDGQRSLAFRALNAQANQLAHYLRRLGVNNEDRVGIYVNRSIEQMVAILGTLKAGGVYLPLDPDYPLERIHFMLNDSKTKVLITNENRLELKQEYTGQIVDLHRDQKSIASESDHNPNTPVSLDSALYVIYSSGSTGTPKGAVGLHRGAINRCNWMWRAFPFSRSDVCCLKTRTSFVDSVWELFGPLLCGIPLTLIPDEVVQDPALLIDALASERVTRLVLVPSLLRAILKNVDDIAARLPHLELWTAGGESLPDELYHLFRKTLPKARLLNIYGSSEVSADVTAVELTADKHRSHVSIGRPIDNTQIYILDKFMNPTPIGVPGEIYVGGDGIARGYHNRPDLTAAHFIQDPFSAEPDARLFKTGDLAKFDENGEILYLGRVDTQIKLRGFRIELGEIEAALESIDEVQTAVVSHEVAPHEHLVAFYTTADTGLSLDAATLRARLRTKLPAYMVPTTFNQIDVMPLLPSGKIDRRTLTNFESYTENDRAAKSVIVTPLERELIEIWREVLQRETIGVDDDFFELGGHSLLAMSIVSRINSKLGRTLQVASLFEAPSVRELARIVDSETHSNTD